MDIGKSFSFVFEDENWLKQLLIGGLVFFIPIVNFAALGYMIAVIRNVRDGRDIPLPEWGTGFGEYFTDGLKVVAGFLVYFSPVIVLSCIYGVVVGLAGGTISDSDTAGGVFAFSSICFNCVIFLFAMAVGLLYPAIFARYAETGEISAMLKFSEVFAFARANISNYLIVWLLMMFVVPIVGSLGAIACGIGVLFTYWYGNLISAHLIGQLLKNNVVI